MRPSEPVEASWTGVILDSGPGASVEPSATVPNTLRFGLFEADLGSGELRKRGRRVPLQDQPFQVLALLLRRPGEIVTREQLQQALWPVDTFVEFEHGVNTAIKKLRQALGDSADNPHFIETLPRKGYRFIAPVAGMESEAPAPTPVPAPVLPVRRRWAWVLAPIALVVIAGAASVWLLNRPGEAPAVAPVPIPLTSYRGFVGGPSFSPDGDRVAFHWNGLKTDKPDIYVKLIGEDQPVRLTTNPAPDYVPAWSPDGRWIAFLRGVSEEKVAVVLIPATGGSERKLTELGQAEEQEITKISWHPGGHWLIVPHRNSAHEPAALFLVSVETSEKRRLTSPPGNWRGDESPDISPDGRAVAFARTETLDRSELYLLELSEDLRPIGEPKRITYLQRCSDEPVWWPDGNSIGFSSGDFHISTTLWRMARRGLWRRWGQPERLPFGTEGAWQFLAVSRQGRVAYVETDFGKRHPHTRRLELAGSHRVEELPMSSTRVDSLPQYSPDGKRMAFGSNRSGSFELWVCNADGSNTGKLTSFGGPDVEGPAWSPDGRRIVFNVLSGGLNDIYIVSADGGKPERLRGSRTKESASAWSRDGKWIYVNSERSGMACAWKIPAEGGAAVQVTQQGGTDAVESPDGKFVYYTRSRREDKFELWQAPVEGGKESRLIESVGQNGAFAVVKGGIYFFSDWNDPSVGYFNFATRRVETAGRVEKLKDVEVVSGLSVSPDSRWLLYATGRPNASGNLMLVENYR